MKKLQLTKRDFAILKALWKWKMLTAGAIWRGFFPGKSPVTVYVRLWHLRDAGFIDWQSIDQSGSGFVWCLTSKGFHLVRDELPDLEQEGYLSESIKHDLFVTASHLGEWLVTPPSQVELFSEQELRRIKKDAYPDWVPQTDVHRPDGYWRIPLLGQMVTIALEVELSQKSALRYRIMANVYGEFRDIFRVVWIVPSLAMARTIRNQIKDSCPDTVDVHNFMLQADFELSGWNAIFQHGFETGQSLSYLLHGGHNPPTTVWSRYLLDTRKAPRICETSLIPAMNSILTDPTSVTVP